MESLLLNGNPKVTLIERFDGTALIIGPEKGKKLRLVSLSAAKQEIQDRGWEVNIAFIKGSPIMREITNGNSSVKTSKKT